MPGDKTVRVIIIAVPILAAGIGGLTLGAGILDEKKVKSVFGTVLRGGAIAGLSYLILFVSLFVGFSFISGEISGLSAFHLCSPAAKAEYNRLLEEYRRILIQTPESNDSKLKILLDKMRKTVESEPLPDLEIELVTESGEVEKYETRHYGFVEDHKLAFEFHDCNQSARDRE